MTPVAPRIVHDVPYVMRIKQASHFAWQVQDLVRLKCHFSWHVQYLVKPKFHFSWQANTLSNTL